MTKRLQFTVGIPPTVNHSHLTTRSGKRIMRPETREYKEQASLVVRLGATESGFSVRSNTRLGLLIRFYFGRAGMDVDNRIKHLQDAIADGVGFNDSIIDELHVYRSIDRRSPRCEVELFIIEKDVRFPDGK